jgi:hypothetical protein
VDAAPPLPEARPQRVRRAPLRQRPTRHLPRLPTPAPPARHAPAQAAYVLPRWLKPETAANRVWLYEGRLHIVPLPSDACPQLPPFPSVDEACKIVRVDHIDTHSPRCACAGGCPPAPTRPHPHTGRAPSAAVTGELH